MSIEEDDRWVENMGREGERAKLDFGWNEESLSHPAWGHVDFGHFSFYSR